MAAAQRSVVADVAMGVLHLFCYTFAHEFLFNPHFDLEPDYIIGREPDPTHHAKRHPDLISHFAKIHMWGPKTFKNNKIVLKLFCETRCKYDFFANQPSPVKRSKLLVIVGDRRQPTMYSVSAAILKNRGGARDVSSQMHKDIGRSDLFHRMTSWKLSPEVPCSIAINQVEGQCHPQSRTFLTNRFTTMCYIYVTTRSIVDYTSVNEL